MKRKGIVFWIFVGFFLILFNPISKASYIGDDDSDKIENMMVTVEPCMKDASLDIQYEITWKVLNSIKVGPLTWVKIGAPNTKFKKPTALTDNIAKIRKYKRSYVRIDFKEEYTTGESVTFKYSIHQPKVCTVTETMCQFEFMPAWFDTMNIDNLTVRWKADNVSGSNSDFQEGDYLVWNRKNLWKGQKLATKIEYKKDVFSKIEKGTSNRINSEPDSSWQTNLQFFIVCLVLIGGVAILCGGGGYIGGYYWHRGFYTGRRRTP